MTVTTALQDTNIISSCERWFLVDTVKVRRDVTSSWPATSRPNISLYPLVTVPVFYNSIYITRKYLQESTLCFNHYFFIPTKCTWYVKYIYLLITYYLLNVSVFVTLFQGDHCVICSRTICFLQCCYIRLCYKILSILFLFNLQCLWQCLTQYVVRSSVSGGNVTNMCT